MIRGDLVRVVPRQLGFSDADNVKFVITDMINNGRHLSRTDRRLTRPRKDRCVCRTRGTPVIGIGAKFRMFLWPSSCLQQAALFANRDVMSTLIRLGLRLPARQPLVCVAYCLLRSCFSDDLMSRLCCCTAVCTWAVNPCWLSLGWSTQPEHFKSRIGNPGHGHAWLSRSHTQRQNLWRL